MTHGPFLFGAIVSALGTLLLIAILVGVLFFLIRFLIVGTKAAQLYIDKNRPVTSVSPTPSTTSTTPVMTVPVATAPVATTPVATAPTAPVAAAATPAKPAPKPRTPKTPPSPDL